MGSFNISLFGGGKVTERHALEGVMSGAWLRKGRFSREGGGGAWGAVSP